MSPSPLFDRDDLEQHLQSALRDYAPEAPDRLWAGIEARLPRRRLAWWWRLTGAGVIALLASIAHGVPAGSALPMQRALTTSGMVSPSLRPIIGLEAFPAWEMTYLKPASTVLFGKGKLTVISPPPQQQVAVAAGWTAKMSRPTNQAIEIRVLVTSPTLWPALAQLPSLMPAKLAKLELTTFQKVAFIKPVQAHKWQIGAVAGPVWQWQQPMSGPAGHPSHLAFMARNGGPATGWQSGLTANFALTTHWQLSTGLLRRSTKLVSAHNAALRLMDGVCLNPYDPGLKEYEFQYALLSGGNNAYLTVRISQVDGTTAMPNDEPFMLTMRTSRQITDWVLPLSLQRTFDHGRWQGFVYGGGLLNMPGKTIVQVEHFSEGCANLCFARNHTPQLTTVEGGKFSLGWSLGAGLNYRLSPHWSLTTAPLLYGQKGQLGLSVNTGISLKF